MRISKLTLACTAGLIGGILTLSVFPKALGGAEPSTPTKKLYLIEEDWEMAINDPDVSTHSPQVTFFACPNAQNEETYFQLQMNYHAHTDFSGGGFHVSAFKAGTQLDQARSQTRIPLRVDGDRIRWTSVLATLKGRFLFAVDDGHGDDWGTFGGPEYLVSMPADGVDSLDNYRPQTSMDMVDVGFGGNRVSSVKLVRVRYYYTDRSQKTVQVHELAE